MKFINEFVGSWIALGDLTFLLNHFSINADKTEYSKNDYFKYKIERNRNHL